MLHFSRPGHPLKHVEDGVEYVYFGHPYPRVRVRATAEDLRDLSKYEAFTCLKQGSHGTRPNWIAMTTAGCDLAWQHNTPPVVGKLRQKLIQQKKLRKRTKG